MNQSCSFDLYKRVSEILDLFHIKELHGCMYKLSILSELCEKYVINFGPVPSNDMQTPIPPSEVAIHA